MSQQVQFLVEWTINDGKTDAFTTLAERAIAGTRADEPNTLRYEWYFSDDKRKCFSLETFTDSDGMLTHLKNAGPLLRELSQVATATRFEIFGHLSADARTMAAKLRATVFPLWAGFYR